MRTKKSTIKKIKAQTELHKYFHYPLQNDLFSDWLHNMNGSET